MVHAAAGVLVSAARPWVQALPAGGLLLGPGEVLAVARLAAAGVDATRRLDGIEPSPALLLLLAELDVAAVRARSALVVAASAAPVAGSELTCGVSVDGSGVGAAAETVPASGQVTTGEAAGMLGVTGSRVRQLLRAGLIEGRHRSGRWLVERDAVLLAAAQRGCG